ncbi:MAG: MFS transporter [Candidatus Brachytrichaceae bacterium NZ_4S206]|jgi:DHA3 family macrolide efflux protein-like MFS transporter
MNNNWKLRFFTIWTGQAFSLLGSWLVQFALIWWLSTTTGSATVLAMATLAGMLPQIVLSPFAGVIVDRFSRRAIMLIADGLTALLTLALAGLFAIGSAQIWHVYAVMFVRSAAGAFHFPAMQASTSLMVPRAQLSRVAGMNQTLQGLMNVVTPPVGALLVSVLPIFQVLLIDVFTALLAIAPLCFIAIPKPRPGAAASARRAGSLTASFLHDFRAGVRYVVAWRGLAIIVLMAMAINFLLMPGASLVPILVTQHYRGGAPELAAMNMAWGLGTILGGVILSAWGGFRRRILTSLMGVMLIGTSFLMQGMLPGTLFPAAVGVWLLLGIANPITNGPVFAVLQAAVEPAMQGRVMTLLMAGSSAMSPLSLLVAGPVADALGVQVWYAIGGAACVLMGLIGFFIPALVNIESQRVSAVTDPSPERTPVAPAVSRVDATR